MTPSIPPNLDSLGGWLALLTRSSYLLFFAVLLGWFGHVGWFDRETDGAVSFNYHPLFMGLAFVVLMPEALLAYADLEERRGFDHAAAKKIHASLHAAASVCILLGLILVFANHAAKGVPAMYSAHSWIGLTAAICAFLQGIVGCVAYSLPTVFGIGGEARARLLPAHRFAGAATFALGVAACVAGFAEKQARPIRRSPYDRVGVVHVDPRGLHFPRAFLSARRVPRFQSRRARLSTPPLTPLNATPTFLSHAWTLDPQSFTKCAPDESDKRCAALSLVNVLVLLVASTASCALGTVYVRWVGGGGGDGGSTGARGSYQNLGEDF